MNKFFVLGFVMLTALFLASSCADTNREFLTKRFAVHSVFSGYPKEWKKGYVVIRDVSESDFAIMQKKLAASGFTTWHHIDSSVDCIIEVRQTCIWTGTEDKPITYACGGEQMRSSVPMIIYSHEDQIVYCAMTTGFGG